MPYMLVLGIKYYRHDTGAAIFSDQACKVEVCAISEIRLNRRKHSFSYPLMSIDYRLRTFGLESLTQVDLIYIDRHIETWPETISQFGDDTAKQTQRTYKDLINTHCDPEIYVDLANRLNRSINRIC